MGIFIERIHLNLQGNDQELRTLALLKILRLEAEYIEDPDQAPTLIQTLRRIYYNEKGEIANLAIRARVRLGKILSEFLETAGDRRRCLDQLRNKKSSAQEILQALWTLANEGKSEDLILCASYLEHKNLKIRIGALEVFLGKASIEDLVHLSYSLSDPSPPARFLTKLVFEKFSADQILNTFQVLKNSTQADIRKKAALALQGLDFIPETSQMLLDLCLDPVLEIRLLAISALGNHPTPQVIEKLKELQNDLSIEVCETATKAIEAIKKKEMDELLTIP